MSFNTRFQNCYDAKENDLFLFLGLPAPSCWDYRSGICRTENGIQCLVHGACLVNIPKMSYILRSDA